MRARNPAAMLDGAVWVGAQRSAVALAGAAQSGTSGGSAAVDALMAFEPRAAALVLEDEVREAILGSLSAAVGARPPPPPSLRPRPFAHRLPPHALLPRLQTQGRARRACC